MSFYHLPVRRNDFEQGTLYDFIFLPENLNDEILTNVDAVLVSLTSERNFERIKQARMNFSRFSESDFGGLTLADAGYYVYEDDFDKETTGIFLENLIAKVSVNLIIITDLSWEVSRFIGKLNKGTYISILTGTSASYTGEKWHALPFDSMALLGLRNYLLKRDDVRKFRQKHIKKIRLSELKKEEVSPEIFFRHSQVSVVESSVTQHAVLGHESLSPAGLDTIAYSAINYWAGLSPVNRFHLIDFSRWSRDYSACYTAMGIWHYLLGMYNKIPDFPFIEKEKLKRILIKHNGMNKTVYTNPLTGRFWLEAGEEPFSLEGLVPISKKKYISLKENADDMENSQEIL